MMGRVDAFADTACILYLAATTVIAPPKEDRPQPTCSLDVQYRGIDIPLIGNVAGHSYLHFSSTSGIDVVIEGVASIDDKLGASIDAHGLPADDKAHDSSAGRISGGFVCDWLQILQGAVSRINSANIDYRLLGPNSNSAAGYFLRQLPNVAAPWVTQVPVGLWGWGQMLPGLN